MKGTTVFDDLQIQRGKDDDFRAIFISCRVYADGTFSYFLEYVKVVDEENVVEKRETIDGILVFANWWENKLKTGWKIFIPDSEVDD